jgi:Glycogen recognition site of AMP-activated protein kinase
MNAPGEIMHESRAFKGRIDVLSSMTRIIVQFIATAPFQPQIKYAMKTSVAIQHKLVIPSLFQIASRIEDFTPATTSKTAPSPDQTSFADLMLHPEKLEAALKIAKSENDAFDAARTFSQSPAKRATRSPAFKNCDSNSGENLSHHPLVGLKTTEFHLEAPFAESVKLAADFTDWEKFPLDMIKSEDGVWYTTVPLPSGHYSYRFIVDGEWCDDPSPILRLHDNPFGRANAVVEVV